MNSESIFTEMLSQKKRVMFILICLCTLFLLYIKKSFIEDQTTAFEFMAGRPEGSWLTVRSALQYLTIPLVYCWKFLVLGFVIWVGSFMYGYRVTFEQCWRIVMSAEFVFLIPEILKILFFLFIETEPDYYRINAFYPLSLINLFNEAGIDERFHYPLKALNLFEIIYMYLLARGLMFFSNRPLRNTITIILISYLPLLLAWFMFYMIVYG
jgi:hypothetical protein